MGKYPLYYCDANKNVSCAKTYCKYIGSGDCELTSSKKFAQIDEKGEEIVRYASEEDMEKEAIELFNLGLI